MAKLKLDDMRPRTQDWKRLMARLDAAYQSGGRAALAAMTGVEPLALRNEKLRDFKMVSNWVDDHPADTVARAEKETLAREINDITGWLNDKMRSEKAMSRDKGIEFER